MDHGFRFGEKLTCTAVLPVRIMASVTAILCPYNYIIRLCTYLPIWYLLFFFLRRKTYKRMCTSFRKCAGREKLADKKEKYIYIICRMYQEDLMVEISFVLIDTFKFFFIIYSHLSDSNN